MSGKTCSLSPQRQSATINPKLRLPLPEGSLSRTQENEFYLHSRLSLTDAAIEGVTLEAMCILCDCSTMRLTVDLGNGIKGMIPKEEVCFSPTGEETKDIAIITRVGKPIQFKVVELCENERGEVVAILSRRAAQREAYNELMGNLRCGNIIPAKVTHLEPFGAFCDIGCGIISLLTVDRISVSRISHPSDRFRPGEMIYALISTIEESGRIYLTHRELLGTWEENAAEFSAGQTVTGIIRSIEEYGVFVELAPNLAGLAEPFEGASPGDSCSVYIKSILPDRMKIKLVMIDTCGTAEKMPLRYYIDPTQISHLSRWQYSPKSSKKLVETVFD